MTYTTFEEDNKKLERVKNENDWDYEGPTKGIKIQPDVDCEPLNLEFDKDNYIQEYCKTQFCDNRVHIKIIEFFKHIEPFFKAFSVIDEGEYWETESIELLEEHIDNCFKAMKEAKEEDNNIQGPFLTSSGRIIDLMEN